MDPTGAGPGGAPVEEAALFRAWPQLRGRVPWMSLGRFPTPVERVDGFPCELWVKHDDASGTFYGGNKVRKLEFLIADARARGARRLVTLGGYGSHHVLATAIYGAASGLEVEAIVFPQPLNAHVREQVLADVAAGAILRPTGGYLGVPGALWSARRRSGSYLVAAGGSSPVGTLGYVSGGLEILEQVRAGALPRPDVVYVALGSNGTAAGLLVSLWDERPIEIAAVRVTDRVVAGARKVRKLALATERLLGNWFNQSPLPRTGQPPSLRVVHDQFGGAYGRSTPAAEEAVSRAAAAGMTLEPTYTGKCMAALLADAAAGRLDGKRVLFINTYNGAESGASLGEGAGAVDASAALAPLLRVRHA